MARTNIQQFRAALADGANQTPPMRAYRTIARGTIPDSAGVDWPQWPAAVARFAAWGDWSTPPATAA